MLFRSGSKLFFQLLNKWILRNHLLCVLSFLLMNLGIDFSNCLAFNFTLLHYHFDRFTKVRSERIGSVAGRALLGSIFGSMAGSAAGAGAIGAGGSEPQHLIGHVAKLSLLHLDAIGPSRDGKTVDAEYTGRDLVADADRSFTRR